MTTTFPEMRGPHDPLAVYVHALRAGDRRLADLIGGRLFPWARRRAAGPGAPPVPPSPAARRTVERLLRSLGL